MGQERSGIQQDVFSRTEPAGELAARMERIRNRLTGPGFPEYTPEFVLADVRLDPAYPRLYSNFSGDISGRYVEALSLVPGTDGGRLAGLVRKLLQYQREDGRFGDASIAFTEAEIGKPHMALLWGNGRLLAGLVTYAGASGDPTVLDAARRLGDFLVRVRRDCSHAGVSERLHGLGAYGLICFTQLIEGLVLLGRASGETAYLDAAREIAPLLPPPGIQHTHGYLSTLRGILLLHEATGDPALLREVETRYRDLVLSPDYVVYGGVLEFFGAETHGLSPADLKKLGALDNKDPQDEGCSEADFVRLGLQLWRVTGRAEYLERAERCLLNHFYCNQFHSGDFGHRVVYHRGFRPSESPGKAWWCCNMHGLRTFPDVAGAMVTRVGAADGGVRVNLYLDCAYSDDDLGFTLRRAQEGAGATLRIERDSEREVPLALRKPEWAERMTVRVNDEAATGEFRDGYVGLTRRWRKGDRIEVELACREYLRLRSGECVDLRDLGFEPVEAALFYGPWLLGVHEAEEPAFFERPWTWGSPNENVVRLPSTLGEARVTSGGSDAGDHAHDPVAGLDVAFRLEYVHGGWPGEAEVTFRPIARQTAFSGQQVLAVWVTFRRASETR